MLPALDWHIVDDEQSGTLSSDVVGHVLSRRTGDADLQRPIAGVPYIDCSHHSASTLLH